MPGKADESSLIDALTGDDAAERMPLKRPPLSDAEIATLRTWIDQGAKAPADETPRPGRRDALGLHPARAARAARRRRPGLGRNPIDRFILARLEREGIDPVARGRPRSR